MRVLGSATLLAALPPAALLRGGSISEGTEMLHAVMAGVRAGTNYQTAALPETASVMDCQWY